jgi:hypothetical protein
MRFLFDWTIGAVYHFVTASTIHAVFSILALGALLLSVLVGIGFYRSARAAGREGMSWAWIGAAAYLGAAIAAGGVLFLLGWLFESFVKGSTLDAQRVLLLISVLFLPMVVAGLIAAKVTAHTCGIKKTKGFDEDIKTVNFLGAAAVVVLLAWAAVPVVPPEDADDPRGQPLFAEFDPAAVASVEILQFDEKKAAERRIEVVRTEVDKKVRWLIASHENYPTDVVVPSYDRKSFLKEEKLSKGKEDPTKDKTTQLAEAVAALTGLKILDVASNSPDDHAEYGVVDPDPNTRDEGATGVGTRVLLKDDSDKELVALIIGKTAGEKPESPGAFDADEKPELHFVRRAGEDAVFVADIKTKKLATRFGKWIETNLLKLNSEALQQIDLIDYSLEGRRVPGGLLSVGCGDSAGGTPRWKLLRNDVPQEGKLAPQKMAEDEELNTVKLDDLKRALSQLAIVDVRRKPPGLSALLKAEGSARVTNEMLSSLGKRGFYLDPDSGALLSSEGEVHCQMKDGAQYVLRFGKIASDIADTSSDEEDESANDEFAQPKEKKDQTHRNRYIFVMVDFDPDAVPKPQLEPVPPEEKEPAAEKSAEEKPAAMKAAKEKPVAMKAAKEEPAAKPDAGEKPAEKPADKAADKAAEKAAAQAKRDKIIQDNKQNQDDYNKKVKEGKKHAQELNARFADWYYVISDDVYRKIHLSRSDVIKKKEKPKEPGKLDEENGPDPDDGHDHDTMDQNPLRELEKLKKEGPGGPDQP